MLHASTGNTLYFRKICALLLQSLQDQVDSLQEQCYGRKHLTLSGVCEHAFLNAILCTEICVKVYLCLLEEFEVGSNNDSYTPRSAQHGGVAIVGITLELLGAQVETQKLVSHVLDVIKV